MRTVGESQEKERERERVCVRGEIDPKGADVGV